jgi:hypothetical protein
MSGEQLLGLSGLVLLAVLVGCDFSDPPRAALVKLDAELRDFAFLAEDEIGIDIRLQSNRESVIVFRVAEYSEDALVQYPLFHAKYLREGKEYPLILEKRYTDDARNYDPLKTGLLLTERIVELDAAAPDFHTTYKYILVANQPITAAGSILIELRATAFDTGLSTNDVKLRDTGFGLEIDTAPYREVAFESISVTKTIAVVRD